VKKSSVVESTRLEQSKQMAKVARGEIDELKNSLRYAEFILERTRMEKEQVE